MPHSDPTTVDSILNNQVDLEQPARGHGYRFNIDSLLLAEFVAKEHPDIATLVDLGTGTGVVALCVNALAKVDNAILIDLDPKICAIARRNVEKSARSLCAEVRNSDVSELSDLPVFTSPKDIVVANPPYTQPSRGRSPKGEGRSMARHGELLPFLRAMAHMLANEQPRACFCYPAQHFADALRDVRTAGLKVLRLQMVHPAPERPARLCLMEVGVKTLNVKLELLGEIYENWVRKIDPADSDPCR